MASDRSDINRTKTAEQAERARANTRTAANSATRSDRVAWAKAFLLGGLALALAGGCSRGSDSRLLGHWLGHPRAVSPVHGAGAAEPAAGDLGQLAFQLDFGDDGRFAMALMRGQGSVDQRSGRYHVTRVYGPRCDVVMTADDPPHLVTLEMVFEDENRMIVREVDGDSRLDTFVFERTTRKESP